jgi:thiol-disulfide isomerase/thioredoxin
MDYKLKYQKYKSKYLKLINNQLGGSLKKPELYLFKADWCGHCNNFKPEWEKIVADSTLTKKVNFITMDSEKNRKDINKWQIGGFPTIILKKNNKLIEYNNNRTFNNIKQFINEHIN